MSKSKRGGLLKFFGVGFVVIVLLVIALVMNGLGSLSKSEGPCSTSNIQDAQSNQTTSLGTGVHAADYFNQFAAADQISMKANAQIIIQVGHSRGLDNTDLDIAIATSIQEANLQNLDHGDRKSHGLFQQQWGMGWGTLQETMDPVHASNAFYDALVKVPNRHDRRMIDVAMAVQRPDPSAYASRWAWDDIAKEIVGGTGSIQPAAAQATAVPAAAIRKVCTTQTAYADKRAAINDLSKVGKYVRGDDYPFASQPILVGSPTHYYFRECVDFVAWRLNEQSGITTGPFKFGGYGNAVTWKDRLAHQHYKVDNTPAVGAVAWFDAHGGDPKIIQAGDLGHVAIVSAVNPDGTVVLEQYNGMPPPNDHQYSVVRVPAQMPGVMYIHVADIKINIT